MWHQFRQPHPFLHPVCLGLLLSLLVPLLAHAAEPKYQGRSLTKWLKLYADAKPDTPDEHCARNAVRAIGTNALPRLTQMLTNNDLSISWAGRNGFQILGPVAAPAVPALAKLLEATNKLSRFMAAQALGHIGAPALPTLMAALRHKRFGVGTDAALAIVELGTNAKPAIPLLLEDLHHPIHFYRERAADTLGNLHIEPDLVIPALTNLISDDPSTAARWIAINSLAQFGPAARSALPAISPFLTNADFSYAASNALREIAPETLTNTLPH